MLPISSCKINFSKWWYMRTNSMKVFILGISALLSSTAFASSQGCREKKNDIKTHCQILSDSCSAIESCLTRRDTCVGRVPENIPEDSVSCRNLNSCMNGIAEKLPSSERCKYKWNDSNPRKEFCSVDRHWLYSEDGCPGKVGGIMSSIAYGLDSEVDTEFTCGAARSKYQHIEESCLESIKDFRSSCSVDGSGGLEQEDEDYIAMYAPAKCEFSENFDDYQQGDFEISTDQRTVSEDQYNGSRGNQKAAPHSDGSAKGERSRTIEN